MEYVKYKKSILRTMAALACMLVLSVLSPLEADGSDALDKLMSSPAINPASTAVLVVDIKSGKTLESHNPDTPLLPASIMKAVTIGSLIDHTGIDFRYHTRVYITGKTREGSLHGNLVIEGCGDPSVNSACEPKSADFIGEIVAALVKKGINRIDGHIVFDESRLSGSPVPASWASGDRNQYYGTGSHAFNFESNRSGKAAVHNPASVFERKLRVALSDAGISVGDESLEEGRRRLLTEHISASIDEIMRSCMMRSDNLFAECLLRTLSVENDGDGSTESGAALSLSHWKRRGARTEGVMIADGSGLSRSNRLTARFMADVLMKKSPDVDYASFFPLAGQEGTLRRFLKNSSLDSYIAMKTGSMNGVQCYAGYKLDDDYAPTHVVVIMLNNFKGREAAKKATADFLLKVFDNG